MKLDVYNKDYTGRGDQYSGIDGQLGDGDMMMISKAMQRRGQTI